jgi:phosphohistidine phosphatase
MTLYLLRHGIAEDPGPNTPDRARRLTPRGRARMRRAAAGLAVLVDPVDAIFTSPYPRAAETAALAAAALSKGPKPRETDALAADTSPMEMLRVLRTLAKGERIVLVGHEPSMSSLASLLLTGSVDGMRIALKKGGCIALVIRTLRPRAAELAWVATPRMLRRIARATTSRSS